MVKRIGAVIVVVLLAIALGCSAVPRPGGSGESSSSPGSFSILRKAQLGSKWSMYQLKVEVGNAELPIMLRLADGDKVDGYFYVESGDNVNFRVTGTSVVHDSVPQGTAGVGVISDRFGFTASPSQGSTYSLTFRPVATSEKSKKVTIFMEVIFPVAGSLFVPLESK